MIIFFLDFVYCCCLNLLASNLGMCLIWIVGIWGLWRPLRPQLNPNLLKTKQIKTNQIKSNQIKSNKTNQNKWNTSGSRRKSNAVCDNCFLFSSFHVLGLRHRTPALRALSKWSLIKKWPQKNMHIHIL